MIKYLIYHEGKGRIVDIPNDWTWEQFGKFQNQFAIEAGSKCDTPYNKYAQMIHLWHFNMTNGMYYDWGLAGPSGANYNLLVFPEHTKEQCENAEEYIRKSFDVVWLYKTQIKEWI